MFADVALSIGFVFALTFILGTYANNYFSTKDKPPISFVFMIILASIASLLLLVFPALFILFGKIF